MDPLRVPYEKDIGIGRPIRRRPQASRSEAPDLKLLFPRLQLTPQLFHSFCVPLLYTTITTDEFPKLLNYAHLASMRRRLALVKTLRIEYQDKVSEPTYLQTFIYGIYGKPYWTLFGRVESKVEKELYGTERCSAELRIIIESLTEMMHLGGIPKVMPNLERVAVSSVYGHETDAWTEFENLQDDTAVDTVAEAHEAR